MEALTAEFRGLWHAGEVVGPWLRKHQNRLRDLVDEGWSWAWIGEALTKAGATYRTGRPWSGEALRSDVKRASRPLKRQRRALPPTPTLATETAPSPASGVPQSGPTIPKASAPRDAASQAPTLAKPPSKPASLSPTTPRETNGPAQAQVASAPKVPRFKVFGLQDQEPSRPLPPEEQEEREAIRKRFS